MPDQEGANNRRYGIEKFKEFILKNQTMSLKKQHQQLQETFMNFKGDCKQSDDITVMGLNFK